jgi:hypothetical protein
LDDNAEHAGCSQLADIRHSGQGTPDRSSGSALQDSCADPRVPDIRKTIYYLRDVIQIIAECI